MDKIEDERNMGKIEDEGKKIRVKSKYAKICVKLGMQECNGKTNPTQLNSTQSNQVWYERMYG
jgi:hypothetical protein